MTASRARALRFPRRAVPLLVAGALLVAVGSGDAHAAARDRNGVRALVVTEALDLGLPVALALAVAHAESNFDAKAMSHKGARGVMQIMPATARGEYGIHADLLWDERINVRLGLHFLKRLLHRYRGRVDLALSYYNGGAAVGTLPRARVIPATAGYVTRVMTLQRRYQAEVRSGGYGAWMKRGGGS